MLKQNPFRSLISQVGYTAESQGKANAQFVVLSLAADVYDADPNNPAIDPPGPYEIQPVLEALRRLAKYSNTDFMRQLHQDLPTVH
jgi:hypothetical protein